MCDYGFCPEFVRLPTNSILEYLTGPYKQFGGRVLYDIHKYHDSLFT